MADCVVCNEKIGIFQDSYGLKDDEGKELYPCCALCSDKTIAKVGGAANFSEIEKKISEVYRCSKCKQSECYMNRIGATGTGLSKMFDIQHNTYLAVACQTCGFTELFDTQILEGPKGLPLSNILDLFFG